MITTRIQIESYLAEYVRGKYYDETVGTVRFPSSSDIYVTCLLYTSDAADEL